MRQLFTTVGLAAALAGCGRDAPTEVKPPSPVKGPPGLTILPVSTASDTVQALLAAPLEVHVFQPNGDAAVGATVVFDATVAPSGEPTMQVSSGSDGYVSSARATVGANGSATVHVRFGTTPGASKISVSVPSLNLRDTARFTVQAGAPVRASIAPRDTIAYIGEPLAFRVSSTDRFGNPSGHPTLTTGAGVTVDGTSVTPTGLGRYQLTASLPGLLHETLTVTALPRGRLAAMRYHYGRTLVMMDLNGGNRTTVELGDTVYGIDWTPDGRVVASVESPGPGFSSDLKVLRAVTPTGQISRFLPTTVPDYQFFPSFSADGRTMVFMGFDPNVSNYVVWRANADGSHPQPTPHRINASWGMAFGTSPDASRLVLYSSIRDLQTQGSTPLPVTATGWRWSPLGDLLAFNEIDRVGVVRPDGSGMRTFMTHFTGHSDRTIDWSGDGKYIVYRGQSWSLEIADVATGARIVIPSTVEFTQGALQ